MVSLDSPYKALKSESGTVTVVISVSLFCTRHGKHTYYDCVICPFLLPMVLLIVEYPFLRPY